MMMRCISHTRWMNNESDSYTCLMPDGRMLAPVPRSWGGKFGENFASCLLLSAVVPS